MKTERLEYIFRQCTEWARQLLKWTAEPLLQHDRKKLERVVNQHIRHNPSGVSAYDLKQTSVSHGTLRTMPKTFSKYKGLGNQKPGEASDPNLRQYSTAITTGTGLAAKASGSGMVSDSLYKGPERRSQENRRNFTPRTFWLCLLKPRRFSGRRRSDRRYPLMDAFDSSAMFLAVTLIVLSLTDAFLTLNILAGGGREVNPVMNYMLGFGTFTFVSSKMLMTAAPIAALTAAGNLLVFGYIRVRTITAVLVGIYTGLIMYEIAILALMR